jgi:hypothetical protein
MPYIDLNGVSQSLIILQVESVGAKQSLTETKYENAFLRVNLNTHPTANLSSSVVLNK